MAKRRNDGRLSKSFTVGGKRYFVYGRNKGELDQAELEKKQEIRKGIDRRNNPTMQEYYDWWNEKRRKTVKETTIRGQRKEFEVMARVYISSASRTFGEMKIKEISINDLITVQNELLVDHMARTTNDYMAHLKHVFKDAQAQNLIEYSPFATLDNIKSDGEEQARDTYHRALTIEEQKSFFSNERCKNSYYYNVFRMAINTGMRVGEIGALKNSDIRNGMIHIERSITRCEDGSYRVGESAKTKKGKRTIPVTDSIKEILADQKRINQMLDGNVVSMDDLIFKAPERGLLMATPADREIKRICKAAGIEMFTMHAFRATFATRCIESGMGIKTLQELLGHENFNLTMSLYGHAMEDIKKAEMNNLKISI